MTETFFWATAGVLVATVFASFFEWTLHRFVMHKPVGPFTYPFRAHALIHHRIFRADESYHLINEADKETIPMAWWNGPVLVAISSIPFWIASKLIGQWSLGIAATSTIAAYYATYEYIHWCMHLPRKRIVERSGIFFRLNGHHILHHRYMHRNFNVVFPLADLCLGTLLLRSKIRFPQVKGPAVPDLQPREVAVSWPRRIFRFVLQCITGVKGA